MPKVGDLCIARRLAKRCEWNGDLCMVTKAETRWDPLVTIKHLPSGETRNVHISLLDFLPDQGDPNDG